MKRTDQGSGFFLLVLAGLICWGSILLPYGNIHNPGPGFFPLWLGVILGALSVGLLLQAARRKEEARVGGDVLAEKVRWPRVLSVLVALVLYGWLMNILGYLIVTFLLMAFLLRFIEPQPWRSVIGWTLVGSLGSYLVFEVWMKLRLPKGFLGI